jgi:TrmH family RNA methyltransferase
MVGSGSENITSSRNPRISALLRLSKRRERERTGLFAFEGLREISLAARAGLEFAEGFYCPSIARGDEASAVLEMLTAAGCPLFSVTPRIFERIAYRGTTGGIMVTAARPSARLQDLPLGRDPVYIVVDGVEKPGNYGAIFRSADGAGVTALILTGEGTDLYNPNTVRASMGTVFTVPAAVSSSQDAIGWFRENGISIAVAVPGAGLFYTEADLSGRCAIVVGSEAEGASERWIESADTKMTIPMLGSADSLNVSASASILAYESVRQKKAAAGAPAGRGR